MEEKGVKPTKKLEVTEDEKVMHDFDAKGKSSQFSMKFIAILLVVAVLGLGTGYMLASSGSGGGKSITSKLTGSSAEKGKTYGDGDPKIFKDTAEGVMTEGGIDGEGQYHLVRDGGEDQYVYLTSSSIDLSEFEGKTVKVWGQTFEGQKAGWLMDVGRLQVVE